MSFCTPTADRKILEYGANLKSTRRIDEKIAGAGQLRTANGINRYRAGWTAEYLVDDGRVYGTLFDRERPIRRFRVALKADGTFTTDVGTGSGCKVIFKT